MEKLKYEQSKELKRFNCGYQKSKEAKETLREMTSRMDVKGFYLCDVDFKPNLQCGKHTCTVYYRGKYIECCVEWTDTYNNTLLEDVKLLNPNDVSYSKTVNINTLIGGQDNE